MVYFEEATNSQINNIYSLHNLDEQSLKDGVRTIIEWLQSQPHLPKITNETIFQNLIIQSKSKVERAKMIAENYCCNRARLSNIFQNRDPFDPEIRKLLRIGYGLPLPKLTPEGFQVMCGQIRSPITHWPSAEAVIKWASMLCDVLLQRGLFSKIILIIDCEKFPLKGGFTFAMKIIKLGFPLVSDVINFGIHKVYIINIHPTFEPLLAFIKCLVKKKTADRIEIWNQPLDKLATVLPQDVLPCEYGGTLSSIDKLHDEFYSHVCKYKDWFRGEGNYQADLSMVPLLKNKSTQNETMSISEGLQGTFRRLAID